MSDARPPRRSPPIVKTLGWMGTFPRSFTTQQRLVHWDDVVKGQLPQHIVNDATLKIARVAKTYSVEFSTKTNSGGKCKMDANGYQGLIHLSSTEGVYEHYWSKGASETGFRHEPNHESFRQWNVADRAVLDLFGQVPKNSRSSG